MTPPKGIVFDCDGVLFESRRANLAYYNDILESFGEGPVCETDTETAELCHTAASPEVLRVLLGEERHQQALERAAAIDYRKFIPYMTPEPGLYEVLEALSARLPLAVATNRGASMSDILDHFELSPFFLTVVTSRDVPRPKPHPDMLQLAVDRLDLSARDLLFVGDSALDKAAAESAGIRFAAYKATIEAPLQLESHYQLLELVRSETTGSPAVNAGI